MKILRLTFVIALISLLSNCVDPPARKLIYDDNTICIKEFSLNNQFIKFKTCFDLPPKFAPKKATIHYYPYIIINNSGRLEIIDLISLESVASVNGLVSPRNILLLPGNEAIISSLYSDSLTIINTLTHDITGYKNIDRSSEDMLLSGNNVFISNWSGGNTITVLDYTMMDIKGVINVVAEPGEMVIDKNNNIWVLCSGGYMNDENPALLRIDPLTLEVSKTIIFDDKNSSPKELCINSSGNMLYYINKDIFKFDITSDVIETGPIISADGRHLYSLEHDHKKNMLLVTDAVDYQQNGYVYIYDDEGNEINSILGGIIPASFCFK